MKKILDSSIQEVQFWLILGFMVLLVGTFIYHLQKSLPEDSIGHQSLEEIRQGFYGSLEMIIIGFLVVGTFGLILFLRNLLEGNGGRVY